MRAVAELVPRLARSAIPVLLLGETGAGKEVIARLLHESGPRRPRPLVAVNCGAIPGQLIEAALFGHEKGSFTGALQQQKGIFEAADGGTVLLDEVGELPPAAQAALLRVLETKRVVRLGSTREIEVGVRLIAATHRDLEAMCRAGSFRLDLYYRVSPMVIHVPPLRERREDIAPLAERFLQLAAAAEGGPPRTLDPEALALLAAHPWPGNVRPRAAPTPSSGAVVVADGDRDEPRAEPARAHPRSRRGFSHRIQRVPRRRRGRGPRPCRQPEGAHGALRARRPGGGAPGMRGQPVRGRAAARSPAADAPNCKIKAHGIRKVCSIGGEPGARFTASAASAS